jgi:hypothetical protein
MFNDAQHRGTKKTARRFAITASVLLLPFSLGVLKAADISSLLEDAKMSANQLKMDAVQMESFSRTKISWQNHASQISRIKEHINKAGKIVSQLEDARASAEQWHQTSVDRIAPTLKELASNTESIIEHLNESPNHLWDPTYKQYLAANAELSGELSQLINDAVSYDRTKTKMKDLQEKLDKLTK